MTRWKVPHILDGRGRPRTGKRYTWDKQEWITDELHPQGILADVTPSPGCTYTRATWPPRGRGRGESLYSPRRISAKLRAVEVFRLRASGHTWQSIANMLGFRDASGPYRAWRRIEDRVTWDEQRKQALRQWSR